MDRSQSSVIPKDLQLNMPTPLYLSKMLFTDVQLLYSKKKTTTTTSAVTAKCKHIAEKFNLLFFFFQVTTQLY